MRYGEKWPEYARQWNAMIVQPARLRAFQDTANEIILHKGIYQEIEISTGVRWYHVAVMHERESSGDFKTYLGNGQPLARRTTIEPKGRGPFTGPKAFLNGAIDALKIDGLDKVKDWRLEKILYYCELFNGGGYSRRGLPSPYIWGGTNIQKRGKFVADHDFDAKVMDTQAGCAPLLWALQQIDHSILFARETMPETALTS